MEMTTFINCVCIIMLMSFWEKAAFYVQIYFATSIILLIHNYYYLACAHSRDFNNKSEVRAIYNIKKIYMYIYIYIYK